MMHLLDELVKDSNINFVLGHGVTLTGNVVKGVAEAVDDGDEVVVPLRWVEKLHLLSKSFPVQRWE